jgi:hypothetical protein
MKFWSGYGRLPKYVGHGDCPEMLALLGPLVLFVIFIQRHLVDFLGNSSGKTKQSVTFEIEFVSHFH